MRGGSWQGRLKELLLQLSHEERLAFFVKYVRAYGNHYRSKRKAKNRRKPAAGRPDPD